MTKYEVILLHFYGIQNIWKYLGVISLRILAVIVGLAVFTALLRNGFSVSGIISDIESHLPSAVVGAGSALVAVWLILPALFFAGLRLAKTLKYCRNNKLTFGEFYRNDRDSIIKIWGL